MHFLELVAEVLHLGGVDLRASRAGARVVGGRSSVRACRARSGIAGRGPAEKCSDPAAGRGAGDKACAAELLSLRQITVAHLVYFDGGI